MAETPYQEMRKIIWDMGNWTMEKTKLEERKTWEQQSLARFLI